MKLVRAARALSAEGFVRGSDQRADPWPPIAEDSVLIDHRSHLEASDAERPLHFFCARFPPGTMRAGECLFLGEKRSCSGHKCKTDFDPGCVKTLRGITAPGILGSVVMRRAKKNVSSARHYDQIRFRFHTTKTRTGLKRAAFAAMHGPDLLY